MEDGMEAVCENKMQVKDIEIENLQKIEAEAEAYAVIITKDECDN